MSDLVDRTDHAYLSIPAAGRYLGVSVQTIYRRIASGDLRAYDVSATGAGKKSIRISTRDLDALLRPLDPTGVVE